MPTFRKRVLPPSPGSQILVHEVASKVKCHYMGNFGEIWPIRALGGGGGLVRLEKEQLQERSAVEYTGGQGTEWLRR